MTESPLEKHLLAVRREIRVRAWSPARVDAALRELVEQGPVLVKRRERWSRATALALAAAAALLVGFVASGSLGLATRGSAVVSVASVRMALGDGAEAHLDPSAKLDVSEQTSARTVVALRAGGARFHVRHDPTRVFRVEAGGVVVEDLGTIFAVEHRGSSVHVAVTEGSVAVSYSEAASGVVTRKTLRGGERGLYPAASPHAASPVVGAAPAVEPAVAVASVDTPKAVVGTSSTADWRELQRAGKHGRAYEALLPGGFRDVRDEPGDLLLAADAARLSSHPAQAATFLRRLLAGHPRDPRAPSAAFTLGWLLMNELGKPREAARAFAQAESFAPRGNLAEDALARAVEAWLRAGDRARATAELERYRKLYPRGRHQGSLDRLVRRP